RPPGHSEPAVRPENKLAGLDRFGSCSVFTNPVRVQYSILVNFSVQLIQYTGISSVRFFLSVKLSPENIPVKYLDRVEHLNTRSPGTPTGHSGRFVPRLPSRKVFRPRRSSCSRRMGSGSRDYFRGHKLPRSLSHVMCPDPADGDARLWWQAYWSMRLGEKDGCSWDQFKELIREKYYPSYYRADMERQFLALTQGTRTVDEYEREFTRLGAF
ncbi:Unknown protein, partial [Striga hermonthica]